MHTEDLLIDNGSNGQAVEAIREGLPQFDVVASLALIIKAVCSVDCLAFVVSPEQMECIWKLKFESEQKGDHLYRLLAAVNVIAYKHVVFI